MAWEGMGWVEERWRRGRDWDWVWKGRTVGAGVRLVEGGGEGKGSSICEQKMIGWMRERRMRSFIWEEHTRSYGLVLELTA